MRALWLLAAVIVLLRARRLVTTGEDAGHYLPCQLATETTTPVSALVAMTARARQPSDKRAERVRVVLAAAMGLLGARQVAYKRVAEDALREVKRPVSDAGGRQRAQYVTRKALTPMPRSPVGPSTPLVPSAPGGKIGSIVPSGCLTVWVPSGCVMTCGWPPGVP